MGPLRVRSGNNEHVCVALGHLPGFNGAAARAQRKFQICMTSKASLLGFNGAAARAQRKSQAVRRLLAF